MSRSAWLVSSSLLLGACLPTSEDLARARAANEFSCPEAQITMTELSPDTEEVHACGRRAVYTCPRSGRFERVCIREADHSDR